MIKYYDSIEGAMSATVAAEKMATLASGVNSILSAFANAKFVGSFAIDEEDIGDKIFAESSFAEVGGNHVILIFVEKVCKVNFGCDCFLYLTLSTPFCRACQ